MMIGNHIYIQENGILFNIIFFILCIYGSYENLINQRISLFGMDRIFYILIKISSKIFKRPIKIDSIVYKKWGVIYLLMALGAILDAIKIV